MRRSVGSSEVPVTADTLGHAVRRGRMPTVTTRLMLLDTASMYFRAFFGVPEIKADNGTPVNAVRGLLDFISRLVGDYRPTHLVCCWDNDWRPQWRGDLIPSYKGHRVVATPPRDPPP